jgi:hypothetical protein
MRIAALMVSEKSEVYSVYKFSRTFHQRPHNKVKFRRLHGTLSAWTKEYLLCPLTLQFYQPNVVFSLDVKFTISEERC